MAQSNKLNSSFRDPSGFLFYKDSKLYRQVNHSYRENYNLLTSSGLYQSLIKKDYLVRHEEVDIEALEPDCYKVIEPEKVNFISYPYEWSFSQLKDAALLTLNIQKLALEKGMSLKDASAYNIQWHKGRPVFIDTLSFEKYIENKPWVAYRQFCQHFLAPLALMAHRDIRLSQLLRIYIDGVPLDLAAKLLPGKTKLKFGLLSHIHAHAKSQQRYADKKVNNKKIKLSKFALLSLINSLEQTVKSLKWKPAGTEWGEYYTFTNYTDDSFDQKKVLIKKWLEQLKPNSVWDVGGNNGEFSRLASDKNIETISFDIDEVAIEKNYLQIRQNKEASILPLVIDLTNPSPALGWQNTERLSLIERGPVDVAFALALVHHLAISNNLPFAKIADFFASICDNLIIEFVPKDDSQVQKLLSTREDIFDKYDADNFVKVFKNYFPKIESEKIEGSKRTLYLMSK